METQGAGARESTDDSQTLHPRSLVVLICSFHPHLPIKSQVPSCHTQADSQQWQEKLRSLASMHGASALLSSRWDRTSLGLGVGVG